MKGITEKSEPITANVEIAHATEVSPQAHSIGTMQSGVSFLGLLAVVLILAVQPSIPPTAAHSTIRA